MHTQILILKTEFKWKCCNGEQKTIVQFLINLLLSIATAKNGFDARMSTYSQPRHSVIACFCHVLIWPRLEFCVFMLWRHAQSEREAKRRPNLKWYFICQFYGCLNGDSIVLIMVNE